MTLLEPFYLLGYCLALTGTHSTLPTASRAHSHVILFSVFLLRSVGCVSLTPLIGLLSPVLIYASGLIGVIAAKFIEGSLLQPDVVPISQAVKSSRPVNHEARLLAARRRRTSSSALTASASASASASAAAAASVDGAKGATDGGAKARRTSLPALLANRNQFPLLVSR